MAEVAIAAAISAAISAATFTVSYLTRPKARPVEKGRLQGDLQITTSEYGSMIPIILGADPGTGGGGGCRVGGNVIWMSDVRKTETTTTTRQGGKGGGGGAQKETTIRYFVDIAIMFGEGELELNALYADSDLLVNNRVGTQTGIVDPAVPADYNYTPTSLYDPSDALVRDRAINRYSHNPVPDSTGQLTGTASAGTFANFRFYSGTETQLPDPLIEADMGVGSTPAFLGRCYIVLENFEVSKYGRVPNFTAILSNKNHKTAKQIAAHLCDRVGMSGSDYRFDAVSSINVRGVPVFNRTAPRQIIEQLGDAFFFDCIESNGLVEPVPRGQAVELTVDADDLGVAEEDSEDDFPAQVESEMNLAADDLPARFDVKFFDPGRDGEVNTQGASRVNTLSKRHETYEVNLVLTIAEARRMAQAKTDQAYREARQTLRFVLPHTYHAVRPTDVIKIPRPSFTHTARVRKVNGFVPGPLEVTAVVERTGAGAGSASTVQPAVQTQIAPGATAGGTGGSIPPAPIPGTSVGTIIDRILRDRELHDGRPGVYVAACSFGNGRWPGAVWHRDGGGGYEEIARLTEQATVGVVKVVPATVTGASTIDVELYGAQTLPSFTAAEVTAGEGSVLIGDLILQYQTATRLSTTPNRWRLSVLSNIAARCSTGNGSLAAGQRFVLLNSALRFVPIELTEKGVARNYKCITVGESVANGAVLPFTANLPNTDVTTPADFQMVAGAGEIRGEWTAIAPAGGCTMLDGLVYEIWDVTGGAPGTLIYSGTSNTYTKTGLPLGTYSWRLRARTRFDDGDYVTDSVAVTTPAGLTVEESDAAPTEASVTKLIFPKDSLEEPAAGQSRYRPLHVLAFEFNGGGAEIDEATIPQAVLPFCLWDCDLVEAYVKDATDTAGSSTFDIRKAPRGSAPPGAADSICGTGAKPNTSGAAENVPQTSFANYSATAIDKYDEVRVVLIANAGHKHLFLYLTVREK